MRLGFSDSGNAPADSTVRKAYDLLAAGFGPGFNGPLLLAAQVPADAPASAFTRVTVAVASTPGVAQVTAPDRNAGRHGRALDRRPGDGAAGRRRRPTS